MSNGSHGQDLELFFIAVRTGSSSEVISLGSYDNNTNGNLFTLKLNPLCIFLRLFRRTVSVGMPVSHETGFKFDCKNITKLISFEKKLFVSSRAAMSIILLGGRLQPVPTLKLVLFQISYNTVLLIQP